MQQALEWCGSCWALDCNLLCQVWILPKHKYSFSVFSIQVGNLYVSLYYNSSNLCPWLHGKLEPMLLRQLQDFEIKKGVLQLTVIKSIQSYKYCISKLCYDPELEGCAPWHCNLKTIYSYINHERKARHSPRKNLLWYQNLIPQFYF